MSLYLEKGEKEKAFFKREVLSRLGVRPLYHERKEACLEEGIKNRALSSKEGALTYPKKGPLD